MTSVFARPDSCGFIHHRALNTHARLRDALQIVAAHPTRRHALEGDLCWDVRPGNDLLFFRHPYFAVDTLSPTDIRRGLAKGDLVRLADVAPVARANAGVVIELKVGRGEAGAALAKLIDYLETNFQNRYWVDGFSLSLLEQVKRINPRTPVTLHTELVHCGRVLIGAPEWPPARVRTLRDLSSIDGVAVRWRGGEARMARSCADVHAAGKALVLSRVFDLRQFECAKLWGAHAAYVPWSEEMLALNDQLDQARAAERNRIGVTRQDVDPMAVRQGGTTQ